MTETPRREPSRAAIAETDPTRLAAFPVRTTADEAASLLASTDGDLVDASATETLYYPYQLSEVRVAADALLNAFERSVLCGVDLRTGKALLVDDDPGSTAASVPAERVLPAERDGEEAAEIARSYVAEVAHRRLTVGRSAELTELAVFRRYRPFHLVACRTADGGRLTYIVDGVTSDFHRVYR